jgi:hypothetical protein
MALAEPFSPPTVLLADALVAPCWLLANGLLVAAAWKWARALFPDDSRFEMLGHTVVLGWGGVVAVALVLNLGGVLTGPLLLGGVAGCALAALLCRRLTPSPAAGPTPPERAEAGWWYCWGVLLAFGLGHVVADGLLVFPKDWDSLAYHIPLIDQWLHARSLFAPDGRQWSSPGNNELLGLWMVAPFSGDFLIHLNNLPATLLLASAAVGLGKRLGLSPSLAHLGSLAVVCNRVVLEQLVDAENDVAAAACFVAAALYVLRSAEGGGAGSTVLGAVSLGLLAGVKFYALGYAALVGACWVLLSLAARGRRGAAGALLAGGLGMLALGGYWYIRNWVAAGSPLYPRDFFRHPDTLTLIYPDAAHTSFLGNGRPELLELYVAAIWRMTGPCQLAGFVLAPLAAAWLIASGPWLCFRGARPAEARGRLAGALLLLGSGALLAVTPFAVEDVPGTLNQLRGGYCPVRYGLCFLSLATLAALLLLQDALGPGLGRIRGRLGGAGPGRARWGLWGLALLPGLALAGAVLFQLLRPDRRLEMDLSRVDGFLIGANLLPVVLLGVLAARAWPGLRRWRAFGLGAAALLAVACCCHLLAERWHHEFARHYDLRFGGEGFRALEQDGPGAGRVCALYYRCYPFFGSRRQYRVCQPVFVFSPEWLTEYLQRQGVTVVGTHWRQRGTIFLGFEECFARHPEAFAPISETQELVLFAVDPGRLGGGSVGRHAGEGGGAR